MPTPRVKNIDFKANPTARANNALSVRPDNCDCHKTICDYEAVVATGDDVTEISLGGDYDGKVLDLPVASYAISAPGAAALKADLQALLDGVAESVDVVFDTDHITITVTGSVVELVGVEGDGDTFTKSNCRAAQ